MPDPFDYDYLINRYRQPVDFQPQQKRGPQFAPLSPQEEEGLLSSIGGKLMGGVSYVGSSLGKAFGGRAVRGALGGRPEELASIIPFSDTLGITDPKNEVKGEDLLQKWGVLDGPGEKGSFEARDLLGPALEIGLDPATYLTLGAGALTKLGKAAKLEGKLAPTTAGRIAAKQGGLAGWHIPFTDAGGVFGTGPGAEAFAKAPLRTAAGALPGALGTTATNLVDKVAAGPVGQLAGAVKRGAAGLFDPSVTHGGKTYLSAEGQDFARAANARKAAAVAEARGTLGELAEPLAHAGSGDWQAGAELANRIEQPGLMGPVRPGIQKAAEDTSALMKKIKDEATAKGIDTTAWPNEGYLPHQKTFIEGEKSHLPGGYTDNFHTKYEEGRIEPFRGLAKEKVIEIMQDPAISGEGRTLNAVLPPGHPAGPKVPTGQLTQEAEHIRRNHLGMTAADDAEFRAMSQAPPSRMMPDPLGGPDPVLNPAYDRLTELRGKMKQAEGLAEIAAKLPADYAQGRRYFGNHPLIDVAARHLVHINQMDGLDAAYDALANSALKRAGQAAEPGSMTVREVLNKMGVKDVIPSTTVGVTPQAVIANIPGQVSGAGAEMLKRLPGKTLADLEKMHVGADLAGELTRAGKAFTTPDVLKPLIGAFDSITNLTKAGQTVVAPAFHVRNLLTGLYQNWVKGFKDPRFGELNPRAYAQPFLDANTLRKGGTIEGVAKDIPYFAGKGLTDAQASDELRKLMFQHDTLPAFGDSKTAEILGQGARGAAVPELKLPQNLKAPGVEELLNPLSKESTLRKAAGIGRPTTWKEAYNPLNVAGVGTKKATTFAPVAAGQEAGQAVDELNRGSAFIANMRAGSPPEVASAMAKAAHYDYSALSPADRAIFRRVIPYWNWSKHNIPFVLEQLATEPGGKMASAIKFAGAQRAQSGFIPDNIGEGLAIPVGKEDNGTQRFLSHFGLPFEDAFNELSPGPNAAQRSGQKLLGQTNPLIKGPLEAITGKQFYSGRDLADLSHAGLTGNTLIDQAVMNSPISRVARMGSTLVDPRKGISGEITNLLGPGKITDVDLDRARNVAARNYIDEVLRGNPAVRAHTNLSVKPEDMGNLSPEEESLFRLMRTMEGEAQKRAKLQRR